MPACILCIQPSEGSHEQMSTVNPQVGELETPHDDDAMGSTSELLRKIVRREGGRKAGRHAAQRQHYTELDFAEERAIPAPASDMFVVAYAEVSEA